MPRRVPEAETSERGLSPADIDTLRAAVADGRRPRVVLTRSAGQVAGQAGQLVRLDDPSAVEWLVVRVGGDELPFAPGDLRLPSRTSRAEASGAGPAHGGRARAVPSEPRPAVAPAAAARDEPHDQPSGEARDQPPRARRPARRPADLAVTLTCHDGQWTVQASRGARTIARPAPVRPAEALRMVGMLDSPAVRDAVEEVVTATRAEARRQAERLRRELAAVEATLAELGGG